VLPAQPEKHENRSLEKKSRLPIARGSDVSAGGEGDTKDVGGGFAWRDESPRHFLASAARANLSRRDGIWVGPNVRSVALAVWPTRGLFVEISKSRVVSQVCLESTNGLSYCLGAIVSN